MSTLPKSATVADLPVAAPPIDFIGAGRGDDRDERVEPVAPAVVDPLIKWRNRRKILASSVTKNFINDIADHVLTRRECHPREVKELQGFPAADARRYAEILADSIPDLRRLHRQLRAIAASASLSTAENVTIGIDQSEAS